jgi:hypothetical protein
MGQRHGLENITVIGFDAKMTEAAGIEYSTLTREDARRKVIKDLQAQGLVDKIDDYTHSVGHCARTGTVIEPLLSEQWFVAMKELARPVADAIKMKRVHYVPERFANTSLDWMEKVAIGTFRASCGGVIVFRFTTGRTAKCAFQLNPSPKTDGTRTKMCSTPGFPVRCGPSPSWVGRQSGNRILSDKRSHHGPRHSQPVGFAHDFDKPALCGRRNSVPRCAWCIRLCKTFSVCA